MALDKAIPKAKAGNYLYKISEAIESTIEGAGYTTIKALVGHGVGRELQRIPRFPVLCPGGLRIVPKLCLEWLLAIEVMYAMGSDKVEVLEDGWTIAMRDGKMSGLFEDSSCGNRQGTESLDALSAICFKSDEKSRYN